MRWLQYWALRMFNPSRADEFDMALIVSYLTECGSSRAYEINWHMDDHTRGRYSWEFRSERRTYRLLDRLEAEGTVKCKTGYLGREYSLTAPAERLLRAV